jgi:hypothetical protein
LGDAFYFLIALFFYLQHLARTQALALGIYSRRIAFEKKKQEAKPNPTATTKSVVVERGFQNLRHHEVF